MKLKKLLALALAGVMAVSMLAGCKGNDNNGNDGEKEPTVSGAAAVLNKVQDDVAFTDGTAAYLNATFKYADLNKVTDDISALSSTSNNGMMNVFLTEGLIDEQFIAERTEGFE